MATERCPKCGSPLKLGCSGYEIAGCPLDPKDCRIKELERQLEEAKTGVYTLKTIPYAQELEDKVAELQSERDAALGQVVVLRAALKAASDLCFQGPTAFQKMAARSWENTLADTSATAQQRVEAIRREATAELRQALSDYGRHIASIPELGIQGCDYDPEEGTACTCGLAAILGEKSEADHE